MGSCFTCIDILDNIFKNKNPEDIFILSNGHAGYALYSILEKYYRNRTIYRTSIKQNKKKAINSTGNEFIVLQLN